MKYNRNTVYIQFEHASTQNLKAEVCVFDERGNKIVFPYSSVLSMQELFHESYFFLRLFHINSITCHCNKLVYPVRALLPGISWLCVCVAARTRALWLPRGVLPALGMLAAYLCLMAGSHRETM